MDAKFPFDTLFHGRSPFIWRVDVLRLHKSCTGSINTYVAVGVEDAGRNYLLAAEGRECEAFMKNAGGGCEEKNEKRFFSCTMSTALSILA